MSKQETIEKLGWYWHAPYGWAHDDVRDDGGHLRFFGSAEEVCEYFGIMENA